MDIPSLSALTGQDRIGSESIHFTTALPAEKASRRRKNLFGRPDLADVYRRARNLLVEHGVFRMARVTTDGDGASSLVICNVWRIDRSKHGDVKTFEFDFTTEKWQEVSTHAYWPDVPLYPIRMAQSLDWWRDVVRRVVWKALMAAGYGALPGFVSEPDSGKKEMTPDRMAYILIQHYIGTVTGRTKAGTNKWKKGFLKPKVMTAGARALRASIFDHVLDADLLSAILAIDYKLITLRDYLAYAVHRDAVLRVARERRNLLPLLPVISKEYWRRKDMFSRKLWVKDGRKRTLVDYSRFGRDHHVFQSCDSRAAWRWLTNAQLTVVRRWAGAGRKNVTVLENLGRANINAKIPAIAWSYIMTASSGNRVMRLGVSECAQRLYRAFAHHCAVMWKERGFGALQAWLKPDPGDLGDIADWLVAEGIAQGFPGKHATWDSLKRRSDDWHERIAIEKMAKRSAYENASWDSLLPETIIEDVICTPLNTVRDVNLEGYRQHHCVGSYAQDCLRGDYRVYSIIEPDGTRSTLGLWLDNRGRWSVEQHRGKHNGTVSIEAARVGRELVNRYQHAHDKLLSAR